MSRRWTVKRVFTWAVFGLVALMAVAAFVFRDDILFKRLDPKIPYPLYEPPKALSYADPRAWALPPLNAPRTPRDAVEAQVFFVHPTTYDGGAHWNAPFLNKQAERFLQGIVLPNYAGPFARVGHVSAPRYRQASLYAHRTLRDDAREARAFAYEDIRRAFRHWLAYGDRGGPIVIVGVEQGGLLVERLLREEIAPNPALRARLVAAYLIDSVAPRDRFLGPGAIPACTAPRQTGCVVGWAEEPEFNPEASKRLSRSMAWTDDGRLETLRTRPALCVNPVLGAETSAEAPARANRGAANATGLEWGARPAFLPRQVRAQCINGLLRTGEPRSSSLKRSGSWSDRKKIKPYNLFYADIEADAQARLAAWRAGRRG